LARGMSRGCIPLGRSRRRCVASITMDPKALGWEGVDWFVLGPLSVKRRTVVNTAMKFQVP